jgi:hypothetical protein
MIFIAYATNTFDHSTNGTCIEKFPSATPLAITVAPLLTSTVFPKSAVPVILIVEILTVCHTVPIVGVEGALFMMTELESVVAVTLVHVLSDISA